MLIYSLVDGHTNSHSVYQIHCGTVLATKLFFEKEPQNFNNLWPCASHGMCLVGRGKVVRLQVLFRIKSLGNHNPVAVFARTSNVAKGWGGQKAVSELLQHEKLKNFWALEWNGAVLGHGDKTSPTAVLKNNCECIDQHLVMIYIAPFLWDTAHNCALPRCPCHQLCPHWSMSAKRTDQWTKRIWERTDV